MAEQGINPAKKLITNGTEVILLGACGVTVKDSKCFLPMALSALPKAFNLTELKKGYFPYFFDTPENEDYVGPWPDALHYRPEKMSPAAKVDFEKWYDGQKDKVSLNQSCPKFTWCFRFSTCVWRRVPTVKVM